MKILLVEDNKNFSNILSEFLKDKGYDIEVKNSGKETKEILKKENYDVIIMDKKLPDIKGEELWKYCLSNYPDTKIVIITDYSDTENTISAIKEGVFDYLVKPIEPDEVLIVLKRIKEFSELKFIKEYQRYQIKKNFLENWFIGVSKIIEEIKSFVLTSAYNASTPILICGETGTGKSILAKAIHVSSPTKDKPFISINCATLPESLVESELFGYEKGAFSGAESQRKGLLEIANSGTVFLDEIGEIPLHIQAKLLHVLDTKKFRRLGGTREIELKARIITATSKNLEELIKKGKFRKDLYYHIAHLNYEIPPLRERKEDIIPIATDFLKQIGGKHLKLSETEKQILLNYSYPGNIKELKNIIERAFILGQGQRLALEKIIINNGKNENQNIEIEEKNILPLEEIEKQYILFALKKYNWNKSKASRMLGISLSTLKRKLKTWNITKLTDESI